MAGPPRLRLHLKALFAASALVACAVVVAIAAGPARAAAPLIAQWPLDSSHVSGGSDFTDDISGNGLALSSPAGTMHFGTEQGKFGGYLASSNTTTLEVNSPLLAPPQLTLMAWVKQAGDPGTLRYIAGRGDDAGTCSGSSYALYTGYLGEPGLHFYVRTPGPTAPPVLTEAPPDSTVFDGNWHLVAGTYDGSDIRLYVDGVQVGPAKPAPAINYSSPIVDSSFYADGYPPAAGCGGTPDFPGQIDELRLYERALSAAELGRLAAAPGPEAPALVPDGGGAGGGSPPGGGGAPPSGGGAPPLGPPTSVGVNLRPLSAPRGGFALIEFATTGPATETRIKVDGSPVLSTDPNASFVGLRFGEPGQHTVTATTIGSTGSTATTTTTVTAGQTGLRKPRGFDDIAISAPSITELLESLKTTVCTPDTTVSFGVAEARGCFRRLKEPATELPKEEAGIAGELVQRNALIEHVQPPCQLADHTCTNALSSKIFNADPSLMPFVSPGIMQINGMTITPLGNASIVVFPAIDRIISKNARISYDGSVFGSIPVQSGELNLDLSSNVKRFTSGDEELSLFEFDTSKAFDDIGGFPINGKVQVKFKKVGESRSTALEVNLALPKELTTAAGADPTAKVEVKADNDRGTYLGFLNIHIGQAFLGPVELANVDFTYNDEGEPAQNCSRKWWKATAEVFFIPVEAGESGAGVKMAPEPQRNGIAFCAGDFHSAGALLHFHFPELPPPEIFPGVKLTDIGFDFQVQEPVLFDGSATIKSAEIVTATGGFLTAFASTEHPYTFKEGDGGGSLKLLAGQTFTSTTVALGGVVDIEPEKNVNLELGSAYLLYSYPDYIKAKGEAHLQTYLFAINAGGEFELSTRTRKFNAVVNGEICLAGGIKVEHVGLCAGGEGRISSRGLSACFNLLDGLWTPGVGLVYGETIPEFFAGAAGDGCKPSHFWEENVRGAKVLAARGSGRLGLARASGRVARASDAPLAFTVKRGETTKNVELTGAGGAPAVTVIGPDGEQLVTEPNLMRHGKNLSVISADLYSRTWIGVENAVPGTYRIVPRPGSPAIVSLKATRYEPDAQVKASVVGKGRNLVLEYDAGRAKDQSVSFFERGKGTWDLLKTVKGGKGKIPFHPTLGPGGRRSIAVQVEVDGIPAPLETLAHFKAPPPPRIGATKQLQVVRHGAKLAVSWQKVPYATGYSVVTEAGGAVRSQRVKAKGSGTTVKNVPVTEAGLVEVVAFGRGGDRGKSAQAKFKALRKPTTRLLPLKELGTGKSADATVKEHKKR